MVWGRFGGKRVAALLLLVVATTATQALAQAGGTGPGSAFELAFWQSVSASDDRGQLLAYLARYPDGTFADLARAKLAALDRQRPPPVADPATNAASRLTLPPPAAPAPASLPPPAAVAPVIITPPPAVPAPAPAPAAAPTAVAAPAPAALPVVAAPVAQQPAAAPPGVQPPVGAAPGASLADQLRALGQSQGRRTVVPGQDGVPARPALATVSRAPLPVRFCSATERNTFHDTLYRPAVETATANNTTTIAHMQLLRRLQQEASQRGDVTLANGLALEAQDYEAVARGAFGDRERFNGLFTDMMAVPIADCGAKP